MKDMTGAVMAPFNAMLILRGLKTLELRMDRHCASAGTIATLLENSYGVQKVGYPGLDSFEQCYLAKCQMAQFGGMIAFELAGGIDAGCSMMNKLQLITRAVSLGDAETLVQHPCQHDSFNIYSRRTRVARHQRGAGAFVNRFRRHR
jgi:methionine-gamma-lyase